MGRAVRPAFRAAACALLVTTIPAAAFAGRGGRAVSPSSVYAAFVVASVADAAGVETPNIYRAPVDAAHAVIVDGREAIVYNPWFLDDVNDRTGTPWAAVSVIAHELGHLYYGHAHAPTDGLSPEVLHEHELEADYYSGLVLARMGASLEEAEAAQNALYVDMDTPTHPDSRRRMNAIRSGWRIGHGTEARAVAFPAGLW